MKAPDHRPPLKPCPFCGGRAVYRRANPDWQPEAMWTAGCNMGCATSTDMETPAQAARWWNMRKRPNRRAM